MHRIPWMIPMSRRFSRMSPLRMWLNCTDDALQFVAIEHLHAAARYADAASFVVWPAANALIDSSFGST